MSKHKYSKEPADDKGNFKIRDETIGKYVMDGNGRQVRHDSDWTDEVIEDLEERTD